MDERHSAYADGRQAKSLDVLGLRGVASAVVSDWVVNDERHAWVKVRRAKWPDIELLVDQTPEGPFLFGDDSATVADEELIGRQDFGSVCLVQPLEVGITAAEIGRERIRFRLGRSRYDLQLADNALSRGVSSLMSKHGAADSSRYLLVVCFDNTPASLERHEKFVAGVLDARVMERMRPEPEPEYVELDSLEESSGR